MRRFCILGGVFLGMVLTACADSNAAARATAGTLVLEVGGQQSSLRQALLAAGITPSVAQRLRDVDVEPAPEQPAAVPPPREQASPASHEPTPAPIPTPAPPVERDTPLVVILGEGQSLMHLARKHLGDGARVSEILQLNGWSEADARRLLAGQKVKLPKKGNSRSSRRS